MTKITKITNISSSRVFSHPVNNKRLQEYDDDDINKAFSTSEIINECWLVAIKNRYNEVIDVIIKVDVDQMVDYDNDGRLGKTDLIFAL